MSNLSCLKFVYTSPMETGPDSQVARVFSSRLFSRRMLELAPVTHSISWLSGELLRALAYIMQLFLLSETQPDT